MGRTCRGICILHKSPVMGNGLMYQSGQKRCTFCGLFLAVETIRCPCCKTILRTKPRAKNSKLILMN
jgi:hydrogenase nickel incorporation protein HypA/HybF